MRFTHSSSSNTSVASNCTNGRQTPGDTVSDKLSTTHKTSSYSQLSRSSAMSRNLNDAIAFMDDQESTLDKMSQQLRDFLASVNRNECQDALRYEYLLYAEAMKSALYAKHRGKPLFDNMYDKPLRMHIELNGVVTPIDLPNPKLRSEPPVQGFIAGVSSGRVPSKQLVNDCLATFLDFIYQVRCEKEKIRTLLVNSKNRQFVRTSSQHLNFIPSQPKHSFWLPDFWNYFCEQFFGIVNSLKVRSA
jgi:hypothetical protein